MTPTADIPILLRESYVFVLSMHHALLSTELLFFSIMSSYQRLHQKSLTKLDKIVFINDCWLIQIKSMENITAWILDKINII